MELSLSVAILVYMLIYILTRERFEVERWRVVLSRNDVSVGILRPQKAEAR
jgi:hypothetical protein